MTNITITLSETTNEDLNALFQFQLDEEANYLAAFTSKDPSNKAAYIEKYSKLLNDPTVNNRTIRANDEIAGSIAKFVMEDDAEITYWIDRKFWGQGIATTALKEFLEIEQAFEGPEPEDIFFGIVERGGAMLMFKSINVEPVPNHTYDVGCGIVPWDAYFYVPDPDSLAAEFASRAVEFRTPLGNNSDDLRGFEIKDIDGHILYFGRPNN